MVTLKLKLVAATFAVMMIGVVLTVVLQVTLSSVPNVVEPSCVMITLEFALIIALVFTWQWPDVVSSQEKTPAAAALQDATEGEAAVPAAAHFVAVA